MKMQYTKRAVAKKSDVNRLRREGKIPAVLYGKGKESLAIFIEEAEFEALLRVVAKGHLSTTVITLVDSTGKEVKVIVKDIQYHVTTYKVLHLDFEELSEDVKIKVKVPITFTGIADCIGIKAGGVLRQVIRQLRVQCYPQDMPKSFQLDVRNLQLKESKKLKELVIPSTVRPLVDLNEVAAVIAKR